VTEVDSKFSCCILLVVNPCVHLVSRVEVSEAGEVLVARNVKGEGMSQMTEDRGVRHL
jgi:hypothetical protein